MKPQAEETLCDLPYANISVPAETPLSEVQGMFRDNTYHFMGVLDSEIPIGMCSRSQIGMLLGSQYGYAVFGRKSVSNFMTDQVLIFRGSTSVLEVLQEAMRRVGPHFYDDVIAIDDEGRFLGLIQMQDLVRKQARILDDQLGNLKQQQAELFKGNEDLKVSLKLLRSSRAQLQALFDFSPVGMALVNGSGVCERLNIKLKACFVEIGIDGVEESLFLHKVIVSDQRDRLTQHLRLCQNELSQAPHVEQEYDVSCPGDRVRRHKIIISWLEDAGQFAVILYDISHEIEMKQQLVREEKQVLVESLVGGIAHEINNKLLPIMGLTDLINAELEERGFDDQAESLSMISQSADEAAKIIRQLRQLTKPTGDMTRTFNLVQLVRDIPKLLAFELKQRDVIVKLEVPEKALNVQGDEAQLKQVILNLTLNALDAMESKEHPEIWIFVFEQSGRIVFEISDNGLGIPEDLRKRVFDPFFTTKDPNRGTGLGLSVCQSIVEQHGGILCCGQSEHLTGAKFTFELSEASQLELLSEQEVVITKKPAPKKNLGGKVLVADDEEFASVFLENVFSQRLGCRVHRVPDGLAAINALENGRYDLVVSDIRMPKFDGIQLYRWIKEHQPHLMSGFIFVSGDEGSAIVRDEIKRENLTVLWKPFTADACLDVCRPFLERSPEETITPAFNGNGRLNEVDVKASEPKENKQSLKMKQEPNVSKGIEDS